MPLAGRRVGGWVWGKEASSSLAVRFTRAADQVLLDLPRLHWRGSWVHPGIPRAPRPKYRTQGRPLWRTGNCYVEGGWGGAVGGGFVPHVPGPLVFLAPEGIPLESPKWDS